MEEFDDTLIVGPTSFTSTPKKTENEMSQEEWRAFVESIHRRCCDDPLEIIPVPSEGLMTLADF